jgi:hypothetical protein
MLLYRIVTELTVFFFIVGNFISTRRKSARPTLIPKAEKIDTTCHR